MDDAWKRAYRGDKGVPHTDPQLLINTWRGAFILASISWLQTHTAKLTRNIRFNWSDKAILIDQQKWKNVFDNMKPKRMALSNTNTNGSPIK